MADFPTIAPLEMSAGGSFSTASSLIGLNTTGTASTAWPAANLAIFVPILVPFPVTVYKMTAGAGGTAGGNFDLGIYDTAGNRLVSSGASARTASVEHVLNTTDVVIGPGLYYLAMAADGTNTWMCWASSVQLTRLCGVMNMATAYTLPATATYAAATNAAIPAIVAHIRPY
jgi:hypothetical protein